VNRLLRVNPAKGPILTNEIDPEMAKSFILGLRIGVKYLYDAMEINIEPLIPDNKLIFATSPITETKELPASSHFLVSKAHSAKTIANSRSAGFVMTKLRFTACDKLMFKA